LLLLLSLSSRSRRRLGGLGTWGCRSRHGEIISTTTPSTTGTAALYNLAITRLPRCKTRHGKIGPKRDNEARRRGRGGRDVVSKVIARGEKSDTKWIGGVKNRHTQIAVWDHLVSAMPLCNTTSIGRLSTSWDSIDLKGNVRWHPEKRHACSRRCGKRNSPTS